MNLMTKIGCKSHKSPFILGGKWIISWGVNVV
jgi:hypothetical protein